LTLWFATRSQLLVGTTNRLIVAPRALPLGRRSRQKRLVECLTDDFRHPRDVISGVPIEGDGDFGGSACIGAKIQTSAINFQFSAKELFRDQGIKSWLQGLSAGNDLALFTVSLAGLVIADPDVPVRVTLNEVNGPTELNAAVEIDRFEGRMRISLPPLCTAVG